MLGIGPAGIASIEYIRKLPGAFVIDSQEQITYMVDGFMNIKNRFLRNAEEIRAYAQEKHEIKSVQQALHEEFEALTSFKKYI